MKRIKQKRIWFLSYVLTVLVCILAGYTVTGFSERVLLDQIDETMVNAFENTVLTIEHRLNTQQTNMYAVLQNQDVVRLSNKYSSYDRNTELEIIGRIMKEISVQFANADCADRHYICFDNKDIVVSGEDSFDKDSAYKNWFSDMYESRNEWLDSIFSIRDFIDFKAFYDKNGQKKVAVIQRSIGNIGAKPPTVAVSIVDERRLFDSFYGNPLLKTVILYNGKQIFSSDSGFEYNEIREDGARVTLDGQSYIQYGKEQNGLYFIQLFSNESYTTRYSVIKTVGLLINVFIFLLGLLLAAYFTRINYLPLRRVMSRLRADVSEENEYAVIEKSTENVLNDRIDAAKRLRETDRRLSLVYNKMLLAAGNKKEIKSVADDIRLKFPHRYFALAAFSMHSIGIIAGGDTARAEDIEIASFTVWNVFAELLPEELVCDWITVDSVCLCILNFSSRDKLEYAYENAREVCGYMEENFKMRLFAYISGCGALGDIPGLKAQLELLHKPAELLEESFCFVWADFAEYVSRIWTEKYSSSLSDAVGNGDADMAERVINDFCALGFMDMTDKTVLRKLVYETLFASYIALKDNGDDGEEIASLINNAKIGEIKKELVAVFRGLAARGGSGGEGDAMIGEIIAFIEENYMNVDLNVSYISNNFNIGISRLSRYFKSNTNEGLADYIRRYRCRKAVGYLEENPDMPVNEIGERCGFYSTGSFIRAFNRIYGVTPGKYQKE